jgi:hypothetical protein
MTDAPEKIWAYAGSFKMWRDHKTDRGQRQTEYTRTDVTDARITELEAALERIASASDYYGKEASDHDEFALAYAHQSTNRLARAALKGED